MHQPFRFLPAAARAIGALLFVSAATTSKGQVVPRATTLEGRIGTAMYVGEFNSLEGGGVLLPRFGYDIAFGLGYNAGSRVAVGVEVGFARLPFVIGDTARAKYVGNFFGPIGSPTYLGSNVAITEANSVSVLRYLLIGRFFLLPDGKVNPYLHGGIGGISFTPKNDSGATLPQSFTGDYDGTALTIPFGVGLRYRLQTNLDLVGQFTANYSGTDYLDGYGHYLSYETAPGSPGPGVGPTPDDLYFALSVGLSLTFPPPPRDSTPSTPPPLADRSSPSDPSARQPQRDTAASPPRASDTTAPRPDTAGGVAATPRRPTPPPLRPSPADTDGDGLTNDEEQGRFFTNPTEPDSDSDDLRDADEVFRYNTSPNNPDTDGDGLSDGQEVHVYRTNPLIRDTDHDGLSDAEEVLRVLSNPQMADSDGDGVGDGDEAARGTNPRLRDTDGDGIADPDDRCPTRFGSSANGGCPE